MEGPATLQTWPLPTPHCTAAFGLLFVFLLMMVHYITCSKVQDPGAIFHFSAVLLPQSSQPLCPGISFSALPPFICATTPQIQTSVQMVM